MSNKVSTNGIEWPISKEHIAIIDGKPKYKVSSSWYANPEDINQYSDVDDGDVPVLPRDPDTYTIDELKKQTEDLKKKKRGGKTFQCPLCGMRFEMRKELAERHLNGDKSRPPACPVRKADPNDDLSQRRPEKLIEIKNRKNKRSV